MTPAEYAIALLLLVGLAWSLWDLRRVRREVARKEARS